MVSVFIATLLMRQDFDPANAWKTVSGRIKQLYWAKKSEPEKLERLLREAEPSALAAKTAEEFNTAMDTMIAKFGDSHFDFMTREDQGYFLFDALLKGDKGAKFPSIGAWFKKTPDGYTVKMVLNGGDAEKAGLRKGDIVTEINDQPFTPVGSLWSNIGKTADIRFRRGKDVLASKVEVRETSGESFFLEPTRRSGTILERNGKKIAYFKLWTMSNEKFRTALENFVYGKAKDTDAFVLDVRDGFGGRPEGFGDPFFRPEAELEWTFGGAGTTKQLFGYQRPLIVIINEGSRSAKEVFSYLMKKSKRAILVGSRTAGDVLGTSPNPVGDWAFLEIPMVDVKIDGQRLEHNPVVADIQVPVEIDSNGKDLFLESALKEAVNQIGKSQR